MNNLIEEKWSGDFCSGHIDGWMDLLVCACRVTHTSTVHCLSQTIGGCGSASLDDKLKDEERGHKLSLTNLNETSGGRSDASLSPRGRVCYSSVLLSAHMLSARCVSSSPRSVCVFLCSMSSNQRRALQHLLCLVRRVRRPETVYNKVELKHTDASPDVLVRYAVLWEKSITVGYELVLACSLDLFISAAATALDFILLPPPKKQLLFQLYLDSDIFVSYQILILESSVRLWTTFIY